jgi:hypothetical protein
MTEIRTKLDKDDSIFVGVLDGENIQSERDFLLAMSETFRFPIVAISVDGYLDWIRDLDWLNKDSYALIIENYGNFIRKRSDVKHKLSVELFTRTIFPHWDEDVTRVTVGGRVKPFYVYLVD